MHQFRAAGLLAGLLATGSTLVRWGLLLASEAIPAASRLGAPVPGDAELLLLGGVGLGLIGSGVWSVVVSLVVLADLTCHRPAAAGGLLRPVWLRSVVVRGFAPTLGVAVLCAGGPAAAVPGDPDPQPGTGFTALTGLPLPTRPVSRPPSPRRPAGIAVRVVRPGESLWSIADDLLGGRAAPARVDQGWRDLYRANRDRVGDDPDLVRPGTRLLVPPALPQHPHTSR